MTSPPYFNKEIYSVDKNQSNFKYPEYKSWVESFLNSLINKSFNYLKNSGYLIINIDDIKVKEKEYKITEDLLKIVSTLSLDHVITHQLELGKMYNIDRGTEPIFVFRKVIK